MSEKRKRKLVREWHFSHYFQGNHVRQYPLSKTADEIMSELNAEFGWDNWRKQTLKPGRKVKEHRH